MFARNLKGALLLAGAGLGAMLTTAAAHAASSPVVVTAEPLMLDKVTTAGGQVTHQLVDPTVTHDKVIPGSHLVLVLDYHNVSGAPVDHFVVTDPLPAALMLADDNSGDFEVSTDGGKTFGKLATLIVTDGKGAQRAAQAADVTTVRWVIAKIAPGAVGKLEFHAVVR